jgi:hypothetical protein
VIGHSAPPIRAVLSEMPEKKFVPVMVAMYPPPPEPEVGDTEEIVGLRQAKQNVKNQVRQHSLGVFRIHRQVGKEISYFCAPACHEPIFSTSANSHVTCGHANTEKVVYSTSNGRTLVTCRA